MTGVIHGLDLNFDLYLFIRFSGACSSNIEFITFRKASTERFISGWSNWRTLNQSLSK